MLKRRYTYTVLRYLHDPATFEFVNVGVVMLCPAFDDQDAQLFARTRTSVGRLREFFPVSRNEFRELMRTVNRLLQKAVRNVADERLFRSSGDALSLAHSVVPPDSSSLQWSPLLAGMTADPQKTFESIFRRMVTKYDVKTHSRRSDEEIWRPVREELQHRNLPVDLEPKIIVGSDDKIEFQHAWKNGVWHVYEPLSLDLADAEGIYRKVHRWLGQLASVTPEATEQFRPHFIVGAPTNLALQPAYHRALRILKKSPGDVKIFEENEVPRLVDKIEDDVRSHSSSPS